MGTSRREFLELTALGTAAVLLPPLQGCGGSGYLSDSERHALTVLADHVLPPDNESGGAALGVVDYIERLLTAFDYTPPRIFAAGPFSGRAPYPADAGGVASTKFPKNSFGTYIPLDRVSERAWRLKIHGSKGVPGGGPNDAVLGPIKGMRDIIRDGIKALPPDYAKLSSDDLEGALITNPEFRTLLITLTAEGAFGAPEYGGNKNGAGWKIAHWEGDTLPLGFSVYDPATGTYRESDEYPISKPNPGADPTPIGTDTAAFFATLPKGF